MRFVLGTDFSPLSVVNTFYEVQLFGIVML